MSNPIDNRIGPNFGKPMSERHPLRECICGADIRQEMGTDDWFNQDDRQGTALYCYPDTKGQDGMVRHEPWEDSDDN